MAVVVVAGMMMLAAEFVAWLQLVAVPPPRFLLVAAQAVQVQEQPVAHRQIHHLLELRWLVGSRKQILVQNSETWFRLFLLEYSPRLCSATNIDCTVVNAQKLMTTNTVVYL